MSSPLPLTPQVLVAAYQHGVFPMARGRGSRAVEWFCPEVRGILPLDGFHVPDSLARRVRSRRFRVTADQAFEAVMRACAQPRTYQRDTWISDALVTAYVRLHRLNLAHSLEAWLPCNPAADDRLDNASLPAPQAGATDADPGRGGSSLACPPLVRDGWRLVGGLYGVSLGTAFFGESMFSAATDASRVCLVHLLEHLRQCGFTLLDVQFPNRHLAQFGAVEVSRDHFLALLAAAVEQPPAWRDFAARPARGE